MIASEFAFLALGLVLGVATGAALVVVLRSRPPAREVRVTVEHDAVPRRGSTLSSDAFVTATAEPARGGPGDRRMVDRDMPVADAPPARRPMPSTAIGIAVGRTPVPSASPVGLAGELVHAAAPGVAVALADPIPGPDAGAPFREAPETAPDTAPEPAEPAFTRLLHGDHRTMLELTDALAGNDADARRQWQADLGELVQATIARSIDLGILHFPLGSAFWDTFTIEQCREIAGSLASMGHRFDGRDAWDGEPPGYRALTIAVADAGVDPRRVRAWPNTAEIADLCRGMRIAPEDLVAERAPELDRDELRQVLGSRADAFEPLWAEWDRVRPLLESTSLDVRA